MEIKIFKVIDRVINRACRYYLGLHKFIPIPQLYVKWDGLHPYSDFKIIVYGGHFVYQNTAKFFLRQSIADQEISGSVFTF